MKLFLTFTVFFISCNSYSMTFANNREKTDSLLKNKQKEEEVKTRSIIEERQRKARANQREIHRADEVLKKKKIKEK